MTKQTGFLSLILVLLFSCRPYGDDKVYFFTYFTNNGQHGLHLAYSYDGLNWESIGDGKSFLMPGLGESRLMRDPCIIKGPDGLFHMVWTTGWWDRIIGYANSPDLINWSEQRAIPVMKHEPEARNSWAPEIFYDGDNEEYLIFWATTIPGRHFEIPTSERENHLNHRMYYCTTRDFGQFTETGMFFNPAFSVIDATILERNNRYYMFVKNENPEPPEKNIRVTSADSPSGPYPVTVSDPITGDYWAEGPTAIEIDDYVYVYFDKYRLRQYGAVRSKDMKVWEDVSDLISFPEGMRHGTVFTAEKRILEQLLQMQ